MARVKITEGSWKDQEGERVGEDELSGVVVVRMAGGRLVEFAPERVEAVEDEPEKDAE